MAYSYPILLDLTGKLIVIVGGGKVAVRKARGVLDAYPPDMPVYRIVNAMMWSSLADPNWLLEYWSRDRLMSVEARRQWVEPDLKSLPF